MKHLMLVCLAAAALTSSSHGQIIEITASDSKCISTSNENWNDNRVRAYWSSRHVDGFMKFDFSAIPGNAQIVAMSLRTFHEEGFGNPHDDPQVRLFRVADDSWARGQSDVHPGLNEVLTPVHSGFPVGDLVPWDWEIDVNAANWADDINDGQLSLVMRNVQVLYSYVYWHGSDSSPAPPVLTVEYTTDGVSLRVTGTCPGQINIAWSNAAPNRQMGIVFARNTGTYTISSGPCAGTQLGLGTNQLQLASTLSTGSGSGSVNSNVGTAACRGYLQLVVTGGSPCATSNVVQLP